MNEKQRKEEKTLKLLIDYFKSGETDSNEFKIGIELEHFVLKRDSLEAVSYFENKGIRSILEEMVSNKWDPVFEGDNILGLNAENASISLEPGGQLELSMSPQASLKEIENIYFSFLKDITLILEKWDLILVNIGYQPTTSIDNIPIIPKKRYDYMFKYFNEKGMYAHNMMKGTASLQINLDYADEEDYIKKYKVANYLSPIIYYIFDNSPIFEGEVCNNCSIRGIIWDNCDNQRCGFSPQPFTSDFGYKKYAQYLLNLPPIFIKDDKESLVYTGDNVFKNLFNPDQYSKENLEHIVTMAFPDVRTKKYIEIRVGDSLPFPYFLSYIAFWKGLLYDQKNLDFLYNELTNVEKRSVIKTKQDIKKGKRDISFAGSNIFQYFSKLYNKAYSGLSQEDKEYLCSLRDFMDKNIIPKEYTLHNLEKGKKEAIKWCISNYNI